MILLPVFCIQPIVPPLYSRCALSLSTLAAACPYVFSGDRKAFMLKSSLVSSSIHLSPLCRQKHTCPEREKYIIIFSAVLCREGEEIPAVKQCTKCRYLLCIFSVPKKSPLKTKIYCAFSGLWKILYIPVFNTPVNYKKMFCIVVFLLYYKQ